MEFMRLIHHAKIMGILLEEDVASQMTAYGEAIQEKNKVINLTSITDDEEFILKHLLDSLTVAVLDEVTGCVGDVGTGGGFPGVIMKIINPSIELYLIDSVKKKLTAVEGICREMGLEVHPLHGRAEEIGHSKYRNFFTTVTARAVAPLSQLIEFCMPLIGIGGHLLAMKGPEADREIETARKAATLYGGRLKRVDDVTLPTDINHKIVIYEKIKDTPKEYPRSLKKILTIPI